MPLAATIAMRRMRAYMRTHTSGGAVARPRTWHRSTASTRMLATCRAPLLSLRRFPAPLRRPMSPRIASLLGRPSSSRQRHRHRASGHTSSARNLRLAFFGIIFLPNLYSRHKRDRTQEVMETKPEMSLELIEIESRRRKLADADELFGESRYQEAFDLLTKMNRADDAQVLWRQARLLYNLARRYSPETKTAASWVAAPMPPPSTPPQSSGLVLSAGDEDDADVCGSFCHAGPALKPSGTAPPTPLPPEEETLATAEERSRMLKDALQLVRRALESDEGCAAAHKWYAVLLDAEAAAAPGGGFRLRAQRLRLVHHHLRRAVELDPRDPAALYMLGEWCETVSGLTWAQRLAAALVLGADAGPTCTLEDAARLLERAEAAAPRFYSANLLALGRVYLGLGREDLAVYYLRQAAQYPEQTDEDQAVRSEAKQMLTKLKARAARAKAAASRAAKLQERGAVSAGGPLQLSETVATVLHDAPFLDPSLSLEEAVASAFQSDSRREPSTGERLDDADGSAADKKSPTQGNKKVFQDTSLPQHEEESEKRAEEAQDKCRETGEVKEKLITAADPELETKSTNEREESKKESANELEKKQEKKDEDPTNDEDVTQVNSSGVKEEQKKKEGETITKKEEEEDEEETSEEWRRQACEL